MDTLDAIKNTKKIYMSDSSLEMLLDFERVLDQLDLYAFANWKKGELVEGPIISRHWVECTFMWPYAMMPDPAGGKRLLTHHAEITYKKDKLVTPVEVEDPDDFRPGTKKAKLRSDPVWLVTIKMPKELVKDIEEGFMEIEGKDIDVEDLEQAYEQGMNDVTDQTQPEGGEDELQI